jgi:hypothetical protein
MQKVFADGSSWCLVSVTLEDLRVLLVQLLPCGSNINRFRFLYIQEAFLAL